MEEKLLKLFKIADNLNEKQNKVYAHITYVANNYKILEIAIRSKKDFSYIENIKIQLSGTSIITLENIIELFESYVGGTKGE